MRFLRTLALVFIPAVLAPRVAAQAEALPPAFEQWDALVEEARAALAAHTGAELADLQFVQADTDRMRVVFSENLAARMPDGTPPPLPESLVDALAPALLGIYHLDSGVVHVSPAAFTRAAELFDRPELLEADALFAVLAHEGAHAVADRRFDLRAFLTKAQSEGEDALMGADAVIEGYAQHVARAVSKARGRSAGFETFTSLIDAVPDELDAGARPLVEAMTAQFAFAYRSGEDFVAAVLAETGPEGVARLFTSPPASRVEVSRPDWYLDPSSRPEHGFELDLALTLVEDGFGHYPDMQFQRRDLTGTELASGNAILGAEKTAEFARLAESARAVVGITPGGENMVVGVAVVCADSADAARLLALMQEASALKDEAMAGAGTLQILDSGTEALDYAGATGIAFWKKMKTAGQEVALHETVLVRGPLMLDLLLSNTEMPRAERLTLAARMLRVAVEGEAARDAAIDVPPAPEGGPEPDSADADDDGPELVDVLVPAAPPPPIDDEEPALADAEPGNSPQQLPGLIATRSDFSTDNQPLPARMVILRRAGDRVTEEVVAEAASEVRLAVGTTASGRTVWGRPHDAETPARVDLVADASGWRVVPLASDEPVTWQPGYADQRASKSYQLAGGNVFHKAVWWQPVFGEAGILTISANAPYLRLWRPGDGGWQAETLWTAKVGGKEQRFRDFEVGDVDGDGEAEIVVVTHDRGGVWVLEQTAGGIEATEVHRSEQRVFVHEVEIGDVDGDGRAEFFTTPSEPNRLDGSEQSSWIDRYHSDGAGGYVRERVAEFTGSTVKEILVTDLDGDGSDELYAVREGRGVEDGVNTLLRWRADGSALHRDRELPFDGQMSRFLVAADTNGDGKRALYATTKQTGVWRLQPDDTERPAEKIMPSYSSGGFEHALTAFDGDGDGRDELYVASDDQKEINVLTRDPASGRFRTDNLVRWPDASYMVWSLAPLPAGR